MYIQTVKQIIHYDKIQVQTGKDLSQSLSEGR